MPQAIDEIPQPNSDFLVPDSTLEVIYDDLHKTLGVDPTLDIQLLTWIEPPKMRTVRGIIRMTGMKACFQVQSPDPNKPGKYLKTFGSTPYDQYKQALAEYGHFVSGGRHPAKTIFTHLLRAHAKTINAQTGLVAMDEAAYQKELEKGRWIVEQAQGDRYEAGVTAF